MVIFLSRSNPAGSHERQRVDERSRGAHDTTRGRSWLPPNQAEASFGVSNPTRMKLFVFKWTTSCRLALLGGLLLATRAYGIETTWIYSVQLSAAVDPAAGRIQLQWPADHLPVSSYTVHRRIPRETYWSEGVTLPGTATSLLEENLPAGATYEYQVVKQGVGYTGYGYITVGLNAPLVDQRGKIILVVDRTIAGGIANELSRLQSDLTGDGWTVLRKDVGREDRPAAVRAQIKMEYDADREQVKAVLLLGHIPVVRSGNLNVDGHEARPMPADVFYGEMDGDWTDRDGDGVYDQSLLPSDVELQVGRVDFADLPGTYAATQPYPGEVELLRRYLDKDHAYRQATIRPAARAIVGNQIGDGSGQAYAASGYRNFAPLVGVGQVVTLNTDADQPEQDRWSTRLARDNYLWAFGCGAGSDLSVSNIGTHGASRDLWSTDFIDLKLKGTFYLFFGSWFADWSKSENVLRSALVAPDYGLAAAWSGRPHLFFHAMGAGETLGQGIRASQNNDGKLYQNQVQRQLRGIHIALLGDPTLRMNMIASPAEATAAAGGSDVVLGWKASAAAVAGYHLYRAANPGGPFKRLTEALVTELRFVDANRVNETATYMIRAVSLQVGLSGSYTDASQGAFANYMGVSPPAIPAPAPAAVVRDTPWIDDALPAGALAYSTDNDRWNWVDADPAPFSGSVAHRSEIAAGLHHHFFANAGAPLLVNAGETLYAYVYLDPANPPRAIELTWNADSWEHRAYWGENLFVEGTDGTVSRRLMGALPVLGRWVRLEVPARVVGLEGHVATGMGFTLFDGRATWDRAGKTGP